VFRSLATRLTASYVLAAIVLVLIVIAAVTAFVLSSFGIATRAASAAIAHAAPDEVRLQIAREGSLDRAAPAIVRSLWQPGMRIVVIGFGRGRRHFLAGTGPPDANGRITIVRRDDREHGGFGPPRRMRGSERMEPFPFALDSLLRLEPVNVPLEAGRLVILPDPGPLGDTIHAFWLAMIPIGAFVVVAAWLAGRAIAQQALRPLVQTTQSLERFGAGDFTPSTVVTAERNEIGALVAAYNAAAAQVAAAFEERRAAEAQMRQFVADAGHELRTPLTVIMGFVDVLRRRSTHDAASAGKIYDTMLVESRRMRALIEKLIVLARLEHPSADPGRRETVDVGDLAARVVAPYDAVAGAPPVHVERDGDALVIGDETDLHDALANLVDNAVKYAPNAPVVLRIHSDADSVSVDVADGGPGIDRDEQSRVFDRFYRGRERGQLEGFGLGLAIARRAVERSGGRLTLVSEPGAGSRFTMRLPKAAHGGAIPLAV